MNADFATEIAQWEAFYSAIAGAAATLLGLLFVALNPAIMRDSGVRGMRVWAAETFHNFLIVLAIALTMLIPGQSPLGMGIPLLILGVHGIYRVIRDIREARSDPDPLWRNRQALTRFLAPGIAYVLLAIAGIAAMLEDLDSADLLIPVIFLLIISASASCWDLLREIGDTQNRT